jgi:hypothetical protein
MMTTPHVTEIPVPIAAVEPDPFIGAPSRVVVARRRLAERAARERRTELVRRLLRTRAAQRHRGR